MNRRTNNAFTLIELLVVVAILAILMTILVPVLGHIQAVSRRALCLSNLRACGQAVGQYTIANKTLYFPYSTYVSTPRPYTKCYFWGTDTDPVKTAPAPLMSHLESPDLLLCPDLPWGSYVPQGARVTEETTAFAYNAKTFDPFLRGTNCLSSMLVENPSELILFADAAIVDYWTAGGVLKNSAYLEPPVSGGARVPTNHFRHVEQTTNVLFADGHAETMTPVGEVDEWNLGFVGERNDPYYIQN
ncbi:MAG: type II secretion system protein [Phycisphaerales bacterium]|jgi:prepilin-type N-terminal cleavage/methylation domain-containing protein/prepilin-type processing-associated H-X9-DG protein|nr:type II secretion system protein [Phycisphaerales bacterium]MBT7171395.1 type II secretion system protein [Phycisphaerales bacterium]